MAYEHTNTKGRKYFLHQKGSLYYFSSKKGPNAIDLPEGFKVVESQATGLPMLKKTAGN